MIGTLRVVCLAAPALLIGLSACNLGPSTAETRPAPERRPTAHVYDEFPEALTLADFQSDEQAGWFRVTGPTADQEDAPQPRIAPLPERNDPAERGLAVVLQSPDDALILDVRRLSRPRPPGDWRGFAVLLMEVHGPPAGADLLLRVSTGDPPVPRGGQLLRVAPGWNRLCVDLDQIDPNIDLPDVRTLEWHLPAAAGPTTIHLDNLALAGRTEWHLGRDAGAGELYAFTRGRRLHVGAAQRFELVFADGVITAWYAGGSNNLAASGGLGPWPVALPADWRDVLDLSHAIAVPWGADGHALQARCRQTLMEATPFRIVIDVQEVSRATSAGRDRTASASARSRRYVIYPDGRVYARIAASTIGAGARDSRLGYALQLDSGAGFQTAPPAGADGAPAPFMLIASRTPQQAALFWTCADPALASARRSLHLDERRSLVVVLGDAPGAETVRSTHLLRFWPADITPAQAEHFAADYQNPVALRPTAGDLVTSAPGDLNNDGFNESRGCYEIALHHGVARFEFAPGELARWAPVFRVHNSTDRQCWIYVDGAALPAEHRDAQGRLLFMLPDTTSGPRTVEIHTRGSNPGP